jgi:hypothetical protein
MESKDKSCFIPVAFFAQPIGVIENIYILTERNNPEETLVMINDETNSAQSSVSISPGCVVIGYNGKLTRESRERERKHTPHCAQ